MTRTVHGRRQRMPQASPAGGPGSRSESQSAPHGEEGSILPLILGYVVLVFALIYVCACATDLYLAQKRLDSVADAAALAGSDGFRIQVSGDRIRAALTDDDVAKEATDVIGVLDRGVALVSADTPDGVSARVTVRATWTPPLLSEFVPSMLSLQATGTSRTAFD